MVNHDQAALAELLDIDLRIWSVWLACGWKDCMLYFQRRQASILRGLFQVPFEAAKPAQLKMDPWVMRSYNFVLANLADIDYRHT